MKLPYHPAPGLGDLLGGSFVVPQNPILDSGTVMVPSVQGQYPNMITRRPRIGDLVSAAFVVPQNPLMPNSMGMGGCGCGGGCNGGGPNFYGMSGVTDDLTSGNWSALPGDAMTWFGGSTSIAGMSIPNWGLAAAGVAAVMMLMPGGKEYRQKSRALRSQYRGYRRAARQVS